jgi:hypothetical protein
MRNFLLFTSIILFITSLSFCIYRWYDYDKKINYFGEDLLGQGYWLHPDNSNILKTRLVNIYEGTATLDTGASTDIEYVLNVKDRDGINSTVSIPSNAIGSVVLSTTSEDDEPRDETFETFLNTLRSSSANGDGLDLSICLSKDLKDLSKPAEICQLIFSK